LLKKVSNFFGENDEEKRKSIAERSWLSTLHKHVYVEIKSKNLLIQ